MYLFVYGTLRRAASLPMHRLLLSAVFVGRGRFQGKLYDLGSYPAAIPSDNPADEVQGEVYLLEEAADTLAALDRYEGCTADDPEPHEYVRVVAEILLDAGDHPTIPAQIYLYNLPTGPFKWIESGDYLEWLGRGSSASNDA